MILMFMGNGVIFNKKRNTNFVRWIIYSYMSHDLYGTHVRNSKFSCLMIFVDLCERIKKRNRIRILLDLKMKMLVTTVNKTLDSKLKNNLLDNSLSLESIVLSKNEYHYHDNLMRLS